MNAAATAVAPLALSSSILLVEDEPILRSSLARGLSRLTNVEVLAAGTVDEAVSFLGTYAPSLLISDIDLPGASGLELVAEFGRRDIDVPIILVTAYLKDYRNQIPERSNLLVLEKPIPLDDLRTRVKHLLRSSTAGLEPPFNLTAIHRELVRSRSHTLPGMPQVPPENLRACAAAPTFNELWTVGIDAVLKRQYAAAARAFRAAGELRQGHPGVLANLQRLKELGYDSEDSDGERN